MKRIDVDVSTKLLIITFKFLKRDFEEEQITLNNVLTLHHKTYSKALKAYLAPPSAENIEKLYKWEFSFPDDFAELAGHSIAVKKKATLPYHHIKLPKFLHFLRPYQKEAIQFMHYRNGRGLIADDMGIGKTYEALGWIRSTLRYGNALIIVPTSTKPQWYRAYKELIDDEIEVLYGQTPYKLSDRSYIINWELLQYWEKELIKIPFHTIVPDECFPYSTKVHTNIGILKIGDIVTNKIKCSALSLDIKTNKLTYKPIVHYAGKKIGINYLMKIKHSFGELICTNNHKIWSLTDGVYKRADEIQNGENLYLLQKTFSNKKGREKYSSILFKKLRSEKSGQVSYENKRMGQNVQTEQKEMGSFRRIPTVPKKTITKNESKQPFIKTRSTEKNERNQIKKWNISQMEWYPGWKWQRVYTTTKNIIRFIRCTLDRRIYFCNRFCRKLPITLQNRHSLSKTQNSDRSGWRKSQSKNNKRKGFKENIFLGNTWVESISFLEQGCTRKSSKNCKSNFVYNIEVKKNHNYFADNILVSNCQYAGNKKSNRTKVLKKLAKKAPSFMPMSGTPIDLKPRQFFPVLNLIDSEVFPDEWKFLNRYCGKKHNGFGFSYDGVSHAEELHYKISRMMIRRHKRDVLKDLPALNKSVVQMSIGKTISKYKALENNFFDTYETHSMSKIEMENEVYNLKMEIFDMKFKSICLWIDTFMTSGEKLLVGVWHHHVIDKLHAHYKSTSTVINGKVTGVHREKALSDFYNDIDILFLQIKSGGVGLDGLQHVCCNTAIVELPPTPTLVNQFISRLERSGQENPMNAYFLMGEGTLELDWMERLDEVSNNIDATVDGKETEDTNLLTMLFERSKK